MEALKAGQRYRCRGCGGLTRFDVIVTRRLKYFHHQTISGEVEPEDEELLDERVEEVSCRWCGNGSAIEVIEGPTETS